MSLSAVTLAAAAAETLRTGSVVMPPEPPITTDGWLPVEDAELAMGDSPGHDFRGNQYTGGIGGGDSGADLAFRAIYTDPKAPTSNVSADHLSKRHDIPKDELHAAKSQLHRDYLHAALHAYGNASHTHYKNNLPAGYGGAHNYELGFDEPLAMGDVVGHDFHGNQHTGGIGGGARDPFGMHAVGLYTNPKAATSNVSAQHLKTRHDVAKDTLRAAKTQRQRDYLHAALHGTGEASHTHYLDPLAGVGYGNPHNGDLGFAELLVFAPIAPPAYVRSVYDQYAMDQAQVDQLRSYLAAVHEDSALLAINDNLRQLGLDTVDAITDPVLLAALDDAAAASATGIADTYNSDLAASIGTDWLDLSAQRGNQMSRQWLDNATSDWVSSRADWKAGSIALNESGTAYNTAQQEWQAQNGTADEARVTPDSGACQACQDLCDQYGDWSPIDGGILDDANDWPLHVGCVHTLEFSNSLADGMDQGSLWTGQAGDTTDSGDSGDGDISFAERLRLGDVAGHDFHGNQWTGGIGGGGDSGGTLGGLGTIPGTDLPRISAEEAIARLTAGAAALPKGPYAAKDASGRMVPTAAAEERMNAVNALVLDPQVHDALSTDLRFVNALGEYPADRQAVQNEIAASWMQSALDHGVPYDHQAIVMGGMPGSGKGTIQDMYGAQLGITRVAGPGSPISNYAQLDPDFFKNQLIDHGLAPDIPGLTPLEMAPLIHEESQAIADMAKGMALESGLNVIVDKTLNNAGQAVKSIGTAGQEASGIPPRTLANSGYSYQLVGANVTLAESYKNVLGRYARGLEQYYGTPSVGNGGRVVSLGYINSMAGTGGYATAPASIMDRIAHDGLAPGLLSPTSVSMFKAGPSSPVPVYGPAPGNGLSLLAVDVAASTATAHVDATAAAAQALAERLGRAAS